MVGGWRTKEGVEVNLDLNSERGGAGSMVDRKTGIIRENERIGPKWFATIRASFRETLKSLPSDVVRR
jgi:hypothetical protein